MEIMDLKKQIALEIRASDSHSFPDNWQLRSFGEIITSSQYGISSSTGGNYTVPILKMNNLQDGHIDLGDLDYIQLSKAEMESLILNKGDLLINRTNSPDLVGKTAIYNLAGEHVFASYLVRFRLGPSVLPEFINYFLNSEPGQRKLKLLATKAVSQANINPSVLKRRLFVPIPPLPEQHAIATALSNADALITSLDKLIAKKCDIKQAAMQQLLTGKTRLPGFSKELKPIYKQTEVGMIPVDWEVHTLGDEIDQLEAGVSVNSVDEEFHIYAHEQAILKTSAVSNGHFFPHENKKIAPRDIKRAKLNPRVNSIIISRMNTPDLVGECGYVDKKYDNLFLPDRLWMTRFKRESKMNVKWLSYLLNHKEYKAKIKEIATGTSNSMKNISKDSFLLISIPFPTPEEQQAIATILSDMDAEITALEQKRDKTRALKQGMMQELLTGKTRLVTP